LGSGLGSGSGSGSGSSSGSNTPPVIIDFTASLTSYSLTVCGQVVDNVDPTGLVVYFGYMLDGQSAVVAVNDTFECIMVGWTEHGTISAWVTDAGGLTSDVVIRMV
jgi:hypothetical protein